MLVAGTPSLTISAWTASARRTERPRLYFGEPERSVKPVTFTAFAPVALAWATASAMIFFASAVSVDLFQSKNTKNSLGDSTFAAAGFGVGVKAASTLAILS